MKRQHMPILVAAFRSGAIVLAAMVVLALSWTLVAVPAAAAEKNGTAIRPFRVNVPEADLAELRRRIAATRWPEKETVADQSQGVPLDRKSVV